jgi:hypothetical protein
MQTKGSDHQSGLYGHRTKQTEEKHKHIHAKSMMETTTSVDDSDQQYKNVCTVKMCNINSVCVKLKDNKA